MGIFGLASVIGLTPVSLYWALQGVVPSIGGGTGVRSLLLAYGLGEAAGWIFWGSLATAFALLTIGYRTRGANAACLLGMILLAYWNRLPLSMAWQVGICFLYCLAFSNSGAVLSWDAWRGATKAVATIETTPIWPLYLIRYQVSLIYLSSGLWKLVGTSWRDGSALHYVLNSDVYARFPGLLSPHIEWLATSATYATLAWELLFPVMVLRPVTRRLALLAGVFIHIGIWATVEVGMFSWVMVAGYLAFLDPADVARLCGRLSGHGPAARAIV